MQMGVTGVPSQRRLSTSPGDHKNSSYKVPGILYLYSSSISREPSIDNQRRALHEATHRRRQHRNAIRNLLHLGQPLQRRSSDLAHQRTIGVLRHGVQEERRLDVAWADGVDADALVAV